MQFKDAAYEILKQIGEPLHYNDITDRALAADILTTTGQTPHASMGALLYTDTLKDDSRFIRAGKGEFALKGKPKSSIETQIKNLNEQARKQLRKLLLKMPARDFEELIKDLLIAMGFDEETVLTTPYSGDGGIDVRGMLSARGIAEVNVAVQAKRWQNNVGPKIVRELRGSLKIHEQGIIITPSGFTSSALREAREVGKTRINLVDGETLVELLIEHKVGAFRESYSVIYLDEERWQELTEATQIEKPKIRKQETHKGVKFPVRIRGNYKGLMYWAELLSTDGKVEFQEKIFNTPSAAAKAVTVEWKSVNGWAFWRYRDAETGDWKKIGELK